MALILGVDPAVANTGLIVFDTDDNYKILYSATLKNPPHSAKDYNVAPFLQIMSAIECLLYTYKIEHVYIEKMFQAKDPMVTEGLFCAAFAARLICAQKGVPYHIVNIMGRNGGWKNFILGNEYLRLKGVSGKRATRAALETILGIKFRTEHLADSAAIALTGWYVTSGQDFRLAFGAPIPEGVGALPPSEPVRYTGRKKTDGKRLRKKDVIDVCEGD